MQNTKSSAWINGVLYVSLGVLAFLLSSSDLRGMVGPTVMIVLGSVNAGLLALKMYLSNSSQAPSEPVAVETKPGTVLETHDVVEVVPPEAKP